MNKTDDVKCRTINWNGHEISITKKSFDSVGDALIGKRSKSIAVVSERSDFDMPLTVEFTQEGALVSCWDNNIDELVEIEFSNPESAMEYACNTVYRWLEFTDRLLREGAEKEKRAEEQRQKLIRARDKMFDEFGREAT